MIKLDITEEKIEDLTPGAFEIKIAALMKKLEDAKNKPSFKKKEVMVEVIKEFFITLVGYIMSHKKIEKKYYREVIRDFKYIVTLLFDPSEMTPIQFFITEEKGDIFIKWKGFVISNIKKNPSYYEYYFVDNEDLLKIASIIEKEKGIPADLIIEIARKNLYMFLKTIKEQHKNIYGF